MTANSGRVAGGHWSSRTALDLYSAVFTRVAVGGGSSTSVSGAACGAAAPCAQRPAAPRPTSCPHPPLQLPTPARAPLARPGAAAWGLAAACRRASRAGRWSSRTRSCPGQAPAQHAAPLLQHTLACLLHCVAKPKTYAQCNAPRDSISSDARSERPVSTGVGSAGKL